MLNHSGSKCGFSVPGTAESYSKPFSPFIGGILIFREVKCYRESTGDSD